MTWRAFPFLVLVSACDAPALEDTQASLDDASTIVALTFDDTFENNYQVGSLAEARGMAVTFYVNSSRIGLSGYMSRAQLLDLQQRGHEIGGHTISHANLTTLAPADARAQVCNDRVALLDAGLSATSFAYPFGANDASVEQIVADCGYNSARDVGGLVTPTSCATCPHANTLPPQNVFALRTSASVHRRMTLADLQLQVTQAEDNGGGFVPLVFHHVCDGCADNGITPALLGEFMDWLAARGPSTQVATVHRVIGGQVKPGVPATPPATEPPPASNLLRNPSLEIDANNNQVPDCWQRGGFGTSTASYRLVSDAHHGNVAQQIEITSLSSGGRRLVSAQDLGSCAPPATPGRRYTMTAFYKSTTPPRFSVYYRTASGAWIWFAQSPLLPTSSTYRQATYTTPPLPQEATALSLGLTIFDVGVLTMDTYTLVDADGAPSDPPPPPPPTSLLQNSSLEVDADGNQVPDCWRTAGFGTNTATFSRVTDAHHGSFAHRLDISSWSSGGRRLISMQDSGACAPSATPGRRYTMSAFYKATAQPRFTVWYRNTSGAWVWFAESPVLPTSTTYRQATFTTPALPGDGRALSIGLSLYGVGSLTTDTYTLVEAP
jgi:peptidoglycan/xylan/chitin deacetylase (PgdA/CDA1 family)